ncbi:alkaline ceramidase ydc1 [Neonectria punicea]|uniref:Alkaline ceramidase ydc1 n=1 Tax=Neonectria punicea TaxID=979145 RepID=A0ABR1GJL8_9HYPO
MWVMESQLRPALETRGLHKSRELLKTMWAMVITAYYYITWGIWLRRCLSGDDDEFALYWPHWLASIPEVRRVKRGSVKKQQ